MPPTLTQALDAELDRVERRMTTHTDLAAALALADQLKERNRNNAASQAAAMLRAFVAEVRSLRAVLKITLRCLTETGHGVTDTVWVPHDVSLSCTLHDYITEVLAGHEAAAVEAGAPLAVPAGNLPTKEHIQELAQEALGLSAHEPLPAHLVASAQEWAKSVGATTDEFHRQKAQPAAQAGPGVAFSKAGERFEYDASDEAQPAAQVGEREALTDDEVGALAYQGNSVSYIKQRATSYGDEIMKCWEVLRDAGQTGRGIKLHKAIRAALATQQSKPDQETAWGVKLAESDN